MSARNYERRRVEPGGQIRAWRPPRLGRGAVLPFRCAAVCTAMYVCALALWWPPTMILSRLARHRLLRTKAIAPRATTTLSEGRCSDNPADTERPVASAGAFESSVPGGVG